MNIELIIIAISILTFLVSVISAVSGMLYQKHREEYERKKLQRSQIIDILIEEYTRLKEQEGSGTNASECGDS
ncbi:MAG: hypothetical protein HWN68_02235 [Desulfobacterales bacterium]|nr:hypothetical protein [Desulfobacterales bacterium]